MTVPQEIFFLTHGLSSLLLNNLRVKQRFPLNALVSHTNGLHILLVIFPYITAPKSELFTLYLICLTLVTLDSVHIVRKKSCNDVETLCKSRMFFGYN